VLPKELLSVFISGGERTSTAHEARVACGNNDLIQLVQPVVQTGEKPLVEP
jgi:hypothetical protein